MNKQRNRIEKDDKKGKVKCRANRYQKKKKKEKKN